MIFLLQDQAIDKVNQSSTGGKRKKSTRKLTILTSRTCDHFSLCIQGIFDKYTATLVS